MSFETISIKKFREIVDRVKDPRASTMVKCAYLLAARNSEILTKTSPWDLLKNASKPYGVFLKYQFQDSETQVGDEIQKEKAFVITAAVAKRGKRLKKKAEGETTTQLSEAEVVEALTKFKLTGLLEKWKSGKVELDPLLIKVLQNKITLKVVALPCSKEFEPWTYDLLKWIQEKGSLNFDMTRQWFWHTVRKELSGLLQKKDIHNVKNPLRHFRVSHLIEYYHLDPYEITSYTGWTAKSTFGQLGIQASPNLDAYAHLRWRLYFPKLLKPLSSFVK